MFKKHRMAERFIPYHQHLIVKGFFLSPPKDENTLNKWLSELVELVGMKVAAGPTSVYVNELGNEGVTGNITLSSSHSSMHIWDSETPALFQFDIYSCKFYDINVVINKLNDFNLVSYEYLLLDRNDGISVISKGTYEKLVNDQKTN